MKKCGSLVNPPKAVTNFHGAGGTKDKPLSVSGQNFWPGTVPNRFTPGHLLPLMTPRGDTHNSYPKRGKTQAP